MSEDLCWLGFSAFSGIGPVRFNKLLATFGSAKDAWKATESDLQKSIGTAITKQVIDFRQSFSLTNYEKKLRDKYISFLLLKDIKYPQLLKNIPNPPFVLYIKGDKALITEMTKEKSIAVVGTRKITHYGKEVTRLLTTQLVEQGFVIVSGLAMGVDVTAHQAAIDNNGKTIAVLGCGVDCCSPSTNLTVYDKIIGHFGAIVSESAFAGSVAKGMFPARNRIIAGLSMGVLVTEGTEDSGALITADNAFATHRPVFAVPGPITSTLSRGPLSLIQKGAKTVITIVDILETFNLKNKKISIKQRSMQGESEIELVILKLLENEALQFDEIVQKLKKSTDFIGSTLSMMEMKGMIKNVGGKFSL